MLLFRRICIRGRLYAGELLALACVCLFSVYWFFNRLEEKKDREGHEARAFSSLALVYFALLFFPVARNSLLDRWFGISFERAIRYHRWIATLTMIFVSLHGKYRYEDFDLHSLIVAALTGLLMILRFGSDVLKTESLTGFPHPPLYGVFAWFAMLVICSTALPCVRRGWFEFFFYPHHLFVIVIVFGTLHVKLLPLWTGPGVVLYIVDRILRVQRRYAWSRGVSSMTGMVVIARFLVT